jgi:hypothetical protein
MRVSELEDLLLEDLDLKGMQVIIREAKGLKDRTVYLTDVTAEAITDYVKVRGPALSNHLFIYRHKPLSKDIVRCRIKGAGKRVKVYVTPHMLRHTFATQLINVGCDVTSIQALLGHKRLNTTMVYARVHNKTVAKDYFIAMAQIEAKSRIQVTTLQPEDGETSLESGVVQPNNDKLLGLLEILNRDDLTNEQLKAFALLRQELAGQSPAEMS